VAVQSDSGVVIFAVNRSQTEPLSLDVDLRSLPELTSAAHTCLADDDADAINTAAAPDRVTPRRLDDPKLDGGRLQAVLPPLSWNMIQLAAR
jgi:alpha-N-arabinofuranosidase